MARQRLLGERAPEGHWVGELSSSALSTATAVCALSIFLRESGQARKEIEVLIENGLGWLARSANKDGGWGDTIKSVSNISTTALCWAAFGSVPRADQRFAGSVRAAETWLSRVAGGITPEQLAPAIIQRYGKDRTFSVPILTMCTLAGRLGANGWKYVIPLPFELAALPQSWFAALRLPVVSYALPALIAIGQARHHHHPTRNPFTRLTRALSKKKTLRVLEKIQPTSGGFLEATPLTSFVTMSLAASGHATNPVTLKAIDFLVASAREDGSWPIDTNLCTWVTTLSINALANSSASSLTSEERSALIRWLLQQQYTELHPYTNAPAGGWAWTDLPGGVPDADDTAGALLALHRLGLQESGTPGQIARHIVPGITWLLNLQNSDGGIPTFCRGWTNLPFDRSSPDITAHALRAWKSWLPHLPEPLRRRVLKAAGRAVDFLVSSQRPDGAWIPLWFGNQWDKNDENHVYGTSRAIVALAAWEQTFGVISPALAQAVNTLLRFQKPDGSWTGAADAQPLLGSPGSVEETTLALEALATVHPAHTTPEVRSALDRGAAWLTQAIENSTWVTASPIGFYFARLWYYERLYPIIFATAALERLSGIPEVQERRAESSITGH